MYDICAADERRDYSGNCVKKNDYCYGQCGDTGGEFLDRTGTCECHGVPSLEVVCDESCRSELPTLRCGSNGIIELVYPSGEISLNESVGVLDSCKEGSNVFSMRTSSGVFAGVLNGSSLFSGGERRRLSYSVGNDFVGILSNFTRSRSLQDDSSIGLELKNPLVCIKNGDSILFDVSKDNYPVYIKDSLLNTNDNFDYSLFRKLDTDALAGVDVESFPFTFSVPGTYVFGIKGTSSITVVTVMPDNVDCSTESNFVEFTDRNLVIMGVTSDSSIVLSPDWNLVWGLLFGAFGLAFGVVGFLYYFRKRAWPSHIEINSQYRTNQTYKTMVSKDSRNMGGVLVKSISADGKRSNKVAVDVEDIDQEATDELMDIECDNGEVDPNFKSLQQRHDDIGKELHIHKDLLNDIDKNLKKEIDDLKSLLTNAFLDFGPSESKQIERVQTLLKKLKRDTHRRDLFEASHDLGEHRSLQALGKVLNILSSLGPSAIADQIVEEILTQVI